MSDNNENTNFELPAVANKGPVNMGGMNPAQQMNQANNPLPANPGPQNMPQQVNAGINMNPSNGMNQMNNTVSMNPVNNMNQMNQMNNMNPNMGNPYNPQGMPNPNGNGKTNPLNGLVNSLKNVDKKVIIAGGAAVVIVILLILVIAFSGGSKGIVKKYAKYYVKGDYKNIVDLYHEDFVDEYSRDFKETMKDVFENYEDEDMDYKSYKVLDKFAYKGDTLDDLKKTLNKTYEFEKDDIKSVVQYLVKYKVDNDGEDIVDYQLIITVKIKNKWYVFNVPDSIY